MTKRSSCSSTSHSRLHSLVAHCNTSTYTLDDGNIFHDHSTNKSITAEIDLIGLLPYNPDLDRLTKQQPSTSIYIRAPFYATVAVTSLSLKVLSTSATSTQFQPILDHRAGPSKHFASRNSSARYTASSLCATERNKRGRSSRRLLEQIASASLGWGPAGIVRLRAECISFHSYSHLMSAVVELKNTTHGLQHKTDAP